MHHGIYTLNLWCTSNNLLKIRHDDLASPTWMFSKKAHALVTDVAADSNTHFPVSGIIGLVLKRHDIEPAVIPNRVEPKDFCPIKASRIDERSPPHLSLYDFTIDWLLNIPLLESTAGAVSSAGVVTCSL